MTVIMNLGLRAGATIVTMPRFDLAEGAKLDHEELMAWIGERVAPQKRIRLVEEIGAVPKSASGKILRREQGDRRLIPANRRPTATGALPPR